jgi:hypothetical protein
MVRGEASGAKKRQKTPFSVRLDALQGAGESQHALLIAFDFSGERDFFAMASNRKKRDLTLYNGAEFYVKGTDNLAGQFYLLTSHPDNPNKMDQWTGFFTVDKTWKKIRIPFNEMIVSSGWIKGGSQRMGAVPGDQIMRLNRVEGVQFGLGSGRNEGVSGTLWIDKIRFYSD